MDKHMEMWCIKITDKLEIYENVKILSTFSLFK